MSCGSLTCFEPAQIKSQAALPPRTALAHTGARLLTRLSASSASRLVSLRLVWKRARMLLLALQ